MQRRNLNFTPPRWYNNISNNLHKKYKPMNQSVLNLTTAITLKIKEYEKKIGGTFSNDVSDAQNRIAISNLYLALAHLVK